MNIRLIKGPLLVDIGVQPMSMNCVGSVARNGPKHTPHQHPPRCARRATQIARCCCCPRPKTRATQLLAVLNVVFRFLCFWGCMTGFCEECVGGVVQGAGSCDSSEFWEGFVISMRLTAILLGLPFSSLFLPSCLFRLLLCCGD